MPSLGYVPNRVRVPSSVTPSALRQAGIAVPQAQQNTPKKQEQIFSGGLVSDFFDLWSAGAYGVAGAGRKFLGLEKDKSLWQSIKSGVKERASWVQTLQEKLPYEPTDSASKNFFKELPRVGFGIVLDMVLDPTIVGSKLKVFRKGAEGVKTGVKAANTYLKEASELYAKVAPKVEGKLGKALVSKYYGMSEANKDAFRELQDYKQYIGKELGKMSDLLEKKKLTRGASQRLTQIFEGSITTDDAAKSFQRKMADELNSVALAINKENPEIIAKETIKKWEGKYLAMKYAKHELADQAQKTLNLPAKRFGPGLGQFKQRESFGEDIAEKVGDFFSLTKTQKARVLHLVENPRELERIETLKRRASELSKQVARKTGSASPENLVDRLKGELLDLNDTVKELSKTAARDPESALERTASLRKAIQNLQSRLNNPASLTSSEIKNIRAGIETLKSTQTKLAKQARLAKSSGLERIARNVLNTQQDGVFTISDLRTQGSARRLQQMVHSRIQETLGPIKEVEGRLLSGLHSELITLAKAKSFNKLSRIAQKETPQFIGEGRKFLDPEIWTAKKYGELSGKFVSDEVYDMLQSSVKEASKLEEMWNSGIRLWKVTRLAFNPASVSRNVLTSWFVLNHLNNVPFYRMDTYFKAFKELRTKGPIYQKARLLGWEMSTQRAAELQTDVVNFYRRDRDVNKLFKTGKEAYTAAVNFYGDTDKFFRLASLVKAAEDGEDLAKAMKRANFYLVDYSDVPGAVDFLRNSPFGAPFVSFTYGVSKVIAKEMLDNPHKLTAYYKFLRGLQALNPLQEDPEVIGKESGVLPDYVKGRREDFVRLPIKDKQGRSQYLDLGYILPFNISQQTGGNWLGGFTPFQGPINTIVDLARNQDSFFGNEIWKSTDSTSEKVSKAMGYVWPQIAPNSPAVPGSFSYNRISEVGFAPRLAEGKLVLEAKPNKEADALVNLLNSFFGVKVQRFDISSESLKRLKEKQFDLIDLRNEIYRIQRNETLLPHEKKAKIKKAQEKLKEFQRQ